MSGASNPPALPRVQDLLASLDERQQQAATCVSGPLLITAPAGSGKTRTIVHRIAYGILTGTFEPEHTLAISFTNRAAGELRDRLQALGAGDVSARTFHSAALRQLRFFWPSVSKEPLQNIQSARGAVLAEIASLPRYALDSQSVKQAVSVIEAAKAHAFLPESIEDFLRVQRLLPDIAVAADVVADIYDAYEDRNATSNLMDFDDVVANLVGLFEEQPAAAAAVQRQYRHITVDEFQDTTVMQRSLLKAWTGPTRDVCAVGDPHQSIYGFAGANADAMRWFARSFAGCELVSLNTCYRSTPQIVSAAGSIRAALDDHTPVRAVRASGAEVTVLPVYPDEVAEARAIAEQINTLVSRGVEPSQIAVLFRIGAQASVIEEALTAVGIPSSAAAPASFFERPAIRKAVTLLRGASHDPRAADVPLAASVSDVLGSIGWQPMQPPALPGPRAEWLGLEALVRLAHDLTCTAPTATIADFVAELDRRSTLSLPPTIHAVSLLTAHSSKGLEWEYVFVCGMAEGLFPYGAKLTPEALSEERRLFYVAVTRARDSLCISGFRQMSSFVDFGV